MAQSKQARGRSTTRYSRRRGGLVQARLVRAAVASARDARRGVRAGAGWIGNYSRCSWATLGEGTFRGGEGTSPTIGEAGRDETVAEYRVETVVPAEKLGAVVDGAQAGPPVRGARVGRLRARRGVKATLWTDGGARGNPGPAAFAYVLEAEDGTVLDARGESIGVATNNVAEYSALVAGLRRAAQAGVTELDVRSDSELMVKQMRGEYRVKNKRPPGPLPRRISCSPRHGPGDVRACSPRAQRARRPPRERGARRGRGFELAPAHPDDQPVQTLEVDAFPGSSPPRDTRTSPRGTTQRARVASRRAASEPNARAR